MMLSSEVVCWACVILMEMSCWFIWEGWDGDPVKKLWLKQWPGRFASSSWWMMAEMREGTSVVRLV